MKVSKPGIESEPHLRPTPQVQHWILYPTAPGWRSSPHLCSDPSCCSWILTPLGHDGNSSACSLHLSFQMGNSAESKTESAKLGQGGPEPCDGARVHQLLLLGVRWPLPDGCIGPSEDSGLFLLSSLQGLAQTSRQAACENEALTMCPGS